MASIDIRTSWRTATASPPGGTEWAFVFGMSQSSVSAGGRRTSPPPGEWRRSEGQVVTDRAARVGVRLGRVVVLGDGDRLGDALRQVPQRLAQQPAGEADAVGRLFVAGHVGHQD